MLNVVAVTESALAAGMLRQQVAASNIANANTPGYRAQRVEQRTGPGGGVSATVEPPPEPLYDRRGQTLEQINDVNLAKEAVDLKESQHQVQVNAAALKRAYETQGSLLDIYG